MVTVKINNKLASLISTQDIETGSVVFSCSWSHYYEGNLFQLPKQILNVDDAISTDDLFTKVSLSGFGEYITFNDKPNTNPQIDYNNQKISFIAIKNIKKDELITYNYSLENFSDVKIQ